MLSGQKQKKLFVLLFRQEKCDWKYLFFSSKGDVFAFIDIKAYNAA